jgi:hypothetical protein
MDNEHKVLVLTENTLQFKFTALLFYHYYMVHYQKVVHFIHQTAAYQKFFCKNKICSHTIKTAVYWHMMLYRFVDRYQCSRGTGGLHLQNGQNIGPTYSSEIFITILQFTRGMASYHSRWQSWWSLLLETQVQMKVWLLKIKIK